MQIFVMLRHLVAQISRFKFDDYHKIRTRVSDLKLFWGGLCPEASHIGPSRDAHHVGAPETLS